MTEGVPFLLCCSLAAPASPSLAAPAFPRRARLAASLVVFALMRPSLCLPWCVPRCVCLGASLAVFALPCPSLCLPCCVPSRVCPAVSLAATTSPRLPCRVLWSFVIQCIVFRSRMAETEENTQDATQRKFWSFIVHPVLLTLPR